MKKQKEQQQYQRRLLCDVHKEGGSIFKKCIYVHTYNIISVYLLSCCHFANSGKNYHCDYVCGCATYDLRLGLCLTEVVAKSIVAADFCES